MPKGLLLGLVLLLFSEERNLAPMDIECKSVSMGKQVKCEVFRANEAHFLLFTLPDGNLHDQAKEYRIAYLEAPGKAPFRVVVYGRRPRSVHQCIKSYGWIGYSKSTLYEIDSRCRNISGSKPR